MNMLHISLTHWIQALTLLVFRVSCHDLAKELLDAHNAARRGVGVPPMSWDNVLADFALNYSQGQINNCIELEVAVVPSGQNLAWGNINDFSATEAVRLWVDQKKCSNNSGTLIVCYYYPAGNVPGKRPTEGIESLVQTPPVAPVSPIPSSPFTRVTWINSTPKRSKSMAGLVIGLSIGLTFGIPLLITCFILRQKRKRAKESDDDRSVFDTLFNDEFGNGIGPRKFSLNELARATSDFSTENKLGEGGFGSVYRGFLRDLDTYIAVKRVSKASKQGIKEYASEVKIISRLRHKNLVKLIGWCHDRGELLLVYEFMPNGSLDTHLFKGKSLLTWETRYKIVQDLASALLYLHEEGDYCVLHRDIKTNNIMLDSSFNAKLGDFGLARLVDHSKGLKNTLLAGTVGYIAPECSSSGKASKESYVYSLGVVALEIACGRRSIEPKFQDSGAVLVPWVWESYGNGKVLDVADKKIGMGFDPKQMECLVIVGLWCAHPSHDQRPTIRQVIQALHFEAPLPDLPSTMPVLSYNAPTAPCTGSSNPLVSNITLTFPR
ncbi:hypothetical protein HRI_005117400 [Hibiscus trionum]|uniref:Protein kinase domain-containing protein n=1 Tax=Hibiscus trionum TaxID=183268 RepID=A0A9W7JFR8_HIBTR|nr:hypothetical protein HRI_005117400 [Hibiscus trionum]